MWFFFGTPNHLHKLYTFRVIPIVPHAKPKVWKHGVFDKGFCPLSWRITEFQICPYLKLRFQHIYHTVSKFRQHDFITGAQSAQGRWRRVPTSVIRLWGWKPKQLLYPSQTKAIRHGTYELEVSWQHSSRCFSRWIRSKETAAHSAHPNSNST